MLAPEIREARLLLAWAGAAINSAFRIADCLGSECAVLDASRGELKECGLQDSQLERLLEARPSRLHLRHEDDLGQRSAFSVVYGEPAFPPRLCGIPSPPAALFVRGRLPDPAGPAVAIIGSRRCTPEGARLAENLAAKLASAGTAVVSGLARGIDSAALNGCLRGGAPAVGVLASGLDFVYPPENVALFECIAGAGALVTEFPLGMRPCKQHFPRRNRLISGLADGVLVVEASNKSGTLITVDHALDQNRIVMAVPGPVDHPAFKGTNRLVRDGAQVILDFEDAALSLGVPYPASNKKRKRSGGPPADLSETDAAVLRLCRRQAMTPDGIALETGLAVSEVLESLARLETASHVSRSSGARFLAPGEGRTR